MAYGRVNVGGGGLQIKNKISGTLVMKETAIEEYITLPSNIDTSNCFVYVYVNGGGQYPGGFNVRAYLEDIGGSKKVRFARNYSSDNYEIIITYNVVEILGAKQIISKTFTVEQSYQSYEFINIPTITNFSKSLLFFSCQFFTSTSNQVPIIELVNSTTLKVSTKSSKLNKTSITVFIIEPY